jgi:hypothetical protein
MDLRWPDEIIEPLLTEFLADQRVRLSPASYRQHTYVIDLFEFSLERYRPGGRRQEFG